MRVVRDGQLVVPSCPDCGCRLEKFHSTLLKGQAYRHFDGYPNRDARGCNCKYLETLFTVENNKIHSFWAYSTQN